MQLLLKVQTLTDAPKKKKKKTCIKSRGVKTFEQNEDVSFFLILPKNHIIFFI